MFIFHEDIELLEGGRSHVRTKFDDEVEAMITTTQIKGPTSLNQTLKATVVHRRTSKDAETRKKSSLQQSVLFSEDQGSLRLDSSLDGSPMLLSLNLLILK